MVKKIIATSYQVIWMLIFCLALPIMGNAWEKEDSEDVFYAISSLRFHLDNLASEQNEDTILFEDQDISNLWETAALDPLFCADIMEAQQYYYLARNETDARDAEEIYAKAKDLLKEIWEELDFRILGENTPSTISKTKIISLDNFECGYPNLEGNPSLNNKMIRLIKPHLLPLDHPAKKAMDDIFVHTNFRPIENEANFKKAGFTVLFHQPFSFIRVASHPNLKGHLLKVYLDSELRKKFNKDGWEWLVMRCQGAENIRNLIQTKKLKYFSVPDKWLYPLPAHSKRPREKTQTIVLLVTDMQLVSHQESINAWMNVNKAQLDELYIILSHGFGSSHVIWNIPYSKSGKFTCIDTEHPSRTPKYATVKNFLSDEMKDYWDKLVISGGGKVRKRR